MARGLVTVQEVGEGSVPTLEVTNTARKPVLIIHGEQLIGAKQNRMTNRSLLLPEESKTLIPVSCMEQGRWHVQSDAFSPAPHHAPSRVRSKARQAEARARRDRGVSSHRDLADAQGEIWRQIQDYSARVGSDSSTGAMDAIFTGKAEELEKWLEAFPPVDHQVGFLAFLGNQVLGLDAVGGGNLYPQLHRRILTGYVMDALSEGGRRRQGERPEESDALAFVSKIKEAGRVPSETPGLGEYRLLEGSLLGGELVVDDHLVHLSAFPRDEGRSADGGNGGGVEADPIRGPRSRRRFK